MKIDKIKKNFHIQEMFFIMVLYAALAGLLVLLTSQKVKEKIVECN